MHEVYCPWDRAIEGIKSKHSIHISVDIIAPKFIILSFYTKGMGEMTSEFTNNQLRPKLLFLLSVLVLHH